MFKRIKAAKKILAEMLKTIEEVKGMKEDLNTVEALVKEHEETLSTHDLDEFVTESDMDSKLDDKLNTDEYDFDDFITQRDAERLVETLEDDVRAAESDIEELKEDVKKLKPVEKKEFVIVATPKPREEKITAVSKEEALAFAEKKFNSKKKDGISYEIKLA